VRTTRVLSWLVLLTMGVRARSRSAAGYGTATVASPFNPNPDLRRPLLVRADSLRPRLRVS
jgi:hypothetical protein